MDQNKHQGEDQENEVKHLKQEVELLKEEVEVLEEIIDLEEQAKAGHEPKKAKKYRLRIDKERILAFAAEFDPQPFHLDETAAVR